MKNLRMKNSADQLFRHCETTESKLDLLAEYFLDAYEWRVEESQLLAMMKKEVKRLEHEIDRLNQEAMHETIEHFQARISDLGAAREQGAAR